MSNPSKFEKAASHAEALWRHLYECRSGARQFPLREDGAISKLQIAKEHPAQGIRLLGFGGSLGVARGAVESEGASSALQLGGLL